MKKTFYLLIFLSPLAVIAQMPITITQSDMPDVNDTIRMSIINGSVLYSTDSTGSNYLWDFSYLQPQTQKVDTFVNTLNTDPVYYYYFNNCYSFLPGYDPDHCASYATPVEPPPSFDSTFQLSDVYYYYKETSSQFTMVGFGAKLNGIPMSQKYDPVDIIYEFPLNYTDTFSSTTSFAYDFPNGDDYYGRTTHRSNTVDGWGTLTTPFGTFQTLRTESVLNITDTFYSDTLNFGYTVERPTQYEYKWLANGKKVPVLQMNAAEGFFGQKIINQIIYRDSVRIDIDNATQNVFTEEEDVLIYPNPNAGTFHMQTNEYVPANTVMRVEIYDILGTLVHFAKIVNPKPVVNLRVPSGVYFVKVVSEKGTTVKKMIVN